MCVCVHLVGINLLSTSGAICQGLFQNEQQSTCLIRAEYKKNKKRVMQPVVCGNTLGESGLERIFDICNHSSVYIRSQNTLQFRYGEI